MDLQLKGKKALVVAASKGIGKGIAQVLADEGCEVILSSSNARNLAPAAETGAVDTEIIDLTNRSSISRGIEAILQRHAHIDIMVTNSPGPPATDVNKPSLEMIDRCLNANLISVMMLCKAYVPQMKDKGFGRLIHLASTTGREPDPGMVLSNISCAGVLAYFKTLARELGLYGITSNAILTGGVMTDRVYELFAKESSNSGKTMEELLREARESMPTGFIPKPDEFARTIAFWHPRCRAT